MKKILFLCHGNICRSPMAEFVFKKLAADAGREGEFEIASAALSREEIGNDIYPPAKRCMDGHGVPYERRRARQATLTDMAHYDLVIIMDGENRWLADRLFGGAYDEKVHMLMEYAGEDRDVADPWYTRDFEAAYRDIKAGCEGLLAAL